MKGVVTGRKKTGKRQYQHMADAEAMLLKNLSDKEKEQLKILLKKILTGLM